MPDRIETCFTFRGSVCEKCIIRAGAPVCRWCLQSGYHITIIPVSCAGGTAAALLAASPYGLCASRKKKQARRGSYPSRSSPSSCPPRQAAPRRPRPFACQHCGGREAGVVVETSRRGRLVGTTSPPRLSLMVTVRSLLPRSFRRRPRWNCPKVSGSCACHPVALSTSSGGPLAASDQLLQELVEYAKQPRQPYALRTPDVPPLRDCQDRQSLTQSPIASRLLSRTTCSLTVNSSFQTCPRRARKSRRAAQALAVARDAHEGFSRRADYGRSRYPVWKSSCSAVRSCRTPGDREDLSTNPPASLLAEGVAVIETYASCRWVIAKRSRSSAPLYENCPFVNATASLSMSFC